MASIRYNNKRVITSGGGGGSSTINPGTGSASFNVPGDTWGLFFLVSDPAKPFITIGTTPGGNEIGEADCTIDGFASITQPFYFAAATVVYLTGFTASTKIIVAKA